MFDICFVVDTTASMNNYLKALRSSLVELFTLSKLIGLDKVCVISYKDYDASPVDRIVSSGWQSNAKSLIDFVSLLKADGGRDHAEMAKSALFFLIDDVIKQKNQKKDVIIEQKDQEQIDFIKRKKDDADKQKLDHPTHNEQNQQEDQQQNQQQTHQQQDGNTTLVYWFTDAPPHFSKPYSLEKHLEQEKQALGENFDWIKLCDNASKCKINIYPIIQHVNNDRHSRLFYSFLAKKTNGICLSYSTNKFANWEIADFITQTSLSILFNLIGAKTLSLSDNLFVSVLDYNAADSEQSLFDSKLIEQTPSHVDNKALFVDNPKIDTDYKKIFQEYILENKHESEIENAFDFIISQEHIKSLTYNPLFGQFWREICRKKDSPLKAKLADKMSKIINHLTGDVKFIVQSFIEQSYLQIESITDLIQKCKSEEILIYDGVVTTPLSIRDVLEMERSCDARIMKQIVGLFTNLRVVQRSTITDLSRINYIPMDVSKFHLFCLLSHLLVPGLRFGLRGSIILAMACIHSKIKLLEYQALEYVDCQKGKWLKVEEPENMSTGFLKLAITVPQAFNTDEWQTIQAYWEINNLRLNARTNVNLEIGYFSQKTLRLDHKSVCRQCNQYRSNTLMTNNNVCAICIETKEDLSDTIKNTLFGQKCPEQVKLPENESYMCECRTCKCHYAVIEIDKLNVLPKCYYCRFNVKNKHTNECTRCLNKFICPSDKVEKSYICKMCDENGKAVTEIYQQTIQDFVKNNDLYIFERFQIKESELSTFFQPLSLYKSQSSWIMNDHSNKSTKIAESTQEQGLSLKTEQNLSSTVHLLIWNDKPVLNSANVHSQLKNWCQNGDVEKDECGLCFEEYNKRQLNKTCNYKNCGVKCCKQCLKQWYNSENAKPGHLANLSNLSCPFCKKIPHIRLLTKYNSRLCELKSFDCSKFKNDYYYAWCTSCNDIKEYCQKSCSETMPRNVSNFKCSDCQSDSTVAIKHCPKCAVPTEKSGGCNHITCICKCDWCFVCGGEYDSKEIYYHMSVVHGGFGIQGYYENDNWSDSDYDSDDRDY